MKVYFPTCFFSKALTNSKFTNNARAAFDWNPDTYEASNTDATVSVTMDRDNTGIDLGSGFLPHTINFNAVVFPYLLTGWLGGSASISFTTYSTSTFTGGTSGHGVTGYFTQVGPKLFHINQLNAESRRYVRWTFNTSGGLVAPAIVMCGWMASIANFNWNDDSAYYQLGLSIVAGDGMRQALPTRSGVYRVRFITFEYISEADFTVLANGFKSCLGSALPFFLMEDDAGTPNVDADLYRFADNGFRYTKPAAELYTVTLMIEEYPRIPVAATGTAFRYPF